MMKSDDELSKNNTNISKKIEIHRILTKYYCYFLKYKML